MVRLNRIYTRTGDDGTTGLVRGPRRPKFDLRVAACGTVDEANAIIGMARLSSAALEGIDPLLARIQNDLFDLGSDLATPGADGPDDAPVLRVTGRQTEWLETEIDRANETLAPLKSFVLPGGSELSARLHLARTVARRAERIVAELISVEPDVNRAVAIYLNRLSDLLFVLARRANAEGEGDVLWTPGRHTGETPPR